MLLGEYIMILERRTADKRRKHRVDVGMSTELLGERKRWMQRKKAVSSQARFFLMDTK